MGAVTNQRSRVLGRRMLFVARYVAIQVGVVLWAQTQPGKLFGFQMFSEATYMKVELYRELLDGRIVGVSNGTWVVHREDGAPVRIRWSRWIKEYRLDSLGQRRRAKRSMDLTLVLAQDAVDYVITRLPEEDRETRRLILVFQIWRAGLGPERARITSRVREPQPGPGNP